MIRQITRAVRRALFQFASNEAAFLFAAFLSQTVLSMDPLLWYRDVTDLFSSLVVAPWGMALCLLRLQRRTRADLSESRADLTLLGLLTLWVVIPFALRFGPTFNTMYSWFNHIVVFFGLYALTSEEDSVTREHLLDCTGALFALLSAALAVPMIWCVATGRPLGEGIGNRVFGVSPKGWLEFGIHYNITGMYALACALFALVGFCRRRNPLVRLLHLIPSVAMMIAVILTQSRTSRYALLLVLALGCLAYLASSLPLRRASARWAVASLAALVMCAVGYIGAQQMTDAALLHVAQVRTAFFAEFSLQQTDAETDEQSIYAHDDPEAAAMDDGLESIPETASDFQLGAMATTTARVAYDSALSGRTGVWRNLLRFWQENPRYLLIGNGMGRTGSRIVEGTQHEADGGVAVHNAYMQFIADYGLIGFALMAAFLCLLVPSMLRVLFAPKGLAHPGDRVLVMQAAAQLIIGLMESQPLGAMSTSNIVLFFSLALIRARAQELRAQRLATAGHAVL